VKLSQVNKIYSILGFEMRLKWLEPHHLYIGLGLLIVSLLGIVSSLQLGGPLGAVLFVIHVWNALLGAYITIDDIYQHHEQVKRPQYHSPVHNWYVNFMATNSSWWVELIRKFNRWADGR